MKRVIVAFLLVLSAVMSLAAVASASQKPIFEERIIIHSQKPIFEE